MHAYFFNFKNTHNNFAAFFFNEYVKREETQWFGFQMAFTNLICEWPFVKQTTVDAILKLDINLVARPLEI